LGFKKIFQKNPVEGRISLSAADKPGFFILKTVNNRKFFIKNPLKSYKKL